MLRILSAHVLTLATFVAASPALAEGSLPSSALVSSGVESALPLADRVVAYLRGAGRIP